MLRLFFGSWSSCLRMYSQSFLVSSVRGSGSLPTTVASAASGCTGLLRAFLGAAAFFGVGIGQLERAGLGCQAKNQLCFSGSAGRASSSANLSRWSWDCSSAELISFGFGVWSDDNRANILIDSADGPVYQPLERLMNIINVGLHIVDPSSA